MKYDTKSIQKRKNSIEIAKKFLWIVLIIFIYNMVLLFISSIKQENGMSLFGYKAYIITTNSMEPSIYSGDVVIVKKCKENKLQKGDVITFWQGQELITHRIARIEEAEGTQEKQNTKKYITKGDNNNVEDEQKKTLNDIEGKVVLVIPKFGKIILSLENKIIFLVVILIILVLCFFKIQKQEKRENRREKKRIEDEKNREN